MNSKPRIWVLAVTLPIALVLLPLHLASVILCMPYHLCMSPLAQWYIRLIQKEIPT